MYELFGNYSNETKDKYKTDDHFVCCADLDAYPSIQL